MVSGPIPALSCTGEKKTHRQVMVLMLVWLFGSIGKGIWDTILDKLEP